MTRISDANRDWQDESRRRRQVSESDRNLPSRFQDGRFIDRKIVVLGGNTLDTDQDGVNYSDEIIDELPSAYDPNVDDTFIDGIGYGTMWVDGIEQDDKVLFVNDPRSSFGHAMLASAGIQDEFRTFSYVRIPVAGGGSKQVWIPG